MTPTPKLRFVERSIDIEENGIHYHKVIKVLQQWWAPDGATENEIRFELNGEWRSVRLEKE
jgi:hypothetical protein